MSDVKGFDGIIEEFENPGISYDDFKVEIYKRLSDAIQGDKEIKYDTVIEKNGQKAEVLSIRENGLNTVPMFRVSQLWQMIREGKNTDYVFSTLIKAYNDLKPKRDFDISSICEFENVKGSVLPRLINADLNRKQLKAQPYVPFLDLAIVFTIEIKYNGSDGIIAVNNSLFSKWDVSIDDLCKAAEENKKEPVLVDLPGTMMVAAAADEGVEINEKDLSQINYHPENKTLWSPTGIQTFTLTFKDMEYGATAITYDGLLRGYAERFGCGMYVIPCSVNEVMIIPSDDGGEKLSEHNSTVREMNLNVTKTDIILSDHAYYYDKSIGEIIY